MLLSNAFVAAAVCLVAIPFSFQGPIIPASTQALMNSALTTPAAETHWHKRSPGGRSVTHNHDISEAILKEKVKDYADDSAKLPKWQDRLTAKQSKDPKLSDQIVDWYVDKMKKGEKDGIDRSQQIKAWANEASYKKQLQEKQRQVSTSSGSDDHQE